jgi:hypothetical protein
MFSFLQTKKNDGGANENDTNVIDVIVGGSEESRAIAWKVGKEFFATIIDMQNDCVHNGVTISRKEKIIKAAKRFGNVALPTLLTLAKTNSIVSPFAGVILEFCETYQGIEANREEYGELLKKLDHGTELVAQFASELRMVFAGTAGKLNAENALKNMTEAVHRSIQVVLCLEKRLKSNNIMLGTILHENDNRYITKSAAALSLSIEEFSRCMSLVYGSANYQVHLQQHIQLEQIQAMQEESNHEINAQFETVIQNQNKQINLLTLLLLQQREKEKARVLREMLLSVDSSSHVRSMLKLYLEGTRGWMFKEVEAWLNEDVGKSARLFWLQADAGMGKSVFAAKQSEVWKYENRLLGRAFFKFNNPVASDPVNVLKSLIYQVLMRYASVQDWMISLMEENPGDSVQHVFKEYLLALLKKLEEEELLEKDRPMLIVLDALDEAGTEGSESRKELLRMLTNHVLRELPASVKLFVTGRPESDLVKGLEKYAHIISDEDERHRLDLKEYVMQSVQ